MGGRLAAIVAASAAAVGLIAAPAAEATFHLIKVREVYPGSSDDTGFVELQMFAAGQTQLTGHKMTLYDSAGALVHTSTFSAGLAKGENQRTVLIGDSNVESAFGVAPDLVDGGLSIPAAGGAACWNAGGVPADCVAWGDFNGATALKAATGTTVGAPVAPGGILAGQAILRTIEPGCPTLLEESDDTNDSATDFTVLPNSPNPRDNAMAPTEKTCAGAPETAIDDRPPPFSNSAGAEFTYEAPTATSYECSLDAAPFASCPNGATTLTGLADGPHTFQVRGVNASGPDPTPASYTWTVDTAAPETTTPSRPADPSPSSSAPGDVRPAPRTALSERPPARTHDRTPSFRFHSSTPGSIFECAFDGHGFRVCRSPLTTKPLPPGRHVFRVRAVSASGSADPSPASSVFRVLPKR